MSNEITFRSDMSVRLLDSMGGDQRVCAAARVSTLGTKSLETSESEGLIRFLMRERHGSPFESVILQWFIEAPIFVWREFMRHRVASYNETSGRYRELEPVFYVPPRDRPLQQIGKTGNYEFVPGDDSQYDMVKDSIRDVCTLAYTDYLAMLNMDIAKEVARMVLPVNIYSSAYVTMNLRGLMNFLSLRTKKEYATFKSHPQREIEQVAEQMEESFKEVAPLAYEAFCINGRVCP